MTALSRALRGTECRLLAVGRLMGRSEPVVPAETSQQMTTHRVPAGSKRSQSSSRNQPELPRARMHFACSVEDRRSGVELTALMRDGPADDRVSVAYL
jgi:hypothetical protein